MRNTILYILVIFFGLGFLFSGAQTITGYYADPSGYGFHHIEAGYLYFSIGFTMLGAVAMYHVMKKIDRRF